MSPRRDHRSDILLSRRHPYEMRRATALRRSRGGKEANGAQRNPARARRAKPLPPSELNTEIEEEVERFAAARSKNPERRFASAAAFLSRLRPRGAAKPATSSPRRAEAKSRASPHWFHGRRDRRAPPPYHTQAIRTPAAHVRRGSRRRRDGRACGARPHVLAVDLGARGSKSPRGLRRHGVRLAGRLSGAAPFSRQCLFNSATTSTPRSRAAALEAKLGASPSHRFRTAPSLVPSLNSTAASRGSPARMLRPEPLTRRDGRRAPAMRYNEGNWVSRRVRRSRDRTRVPAPRPHPPAVYVFWAATATVMPSRTASCKRRTSGGCARVEAGFGGNSTAPPSSCSALHEETARRAALPTGASNRPFVMWCASEVFGSYDAQCKSSKHANAEYRRLPRNS